MSEPTKCPKCNDMHRRAQAAESAMKKNYFWEFAFNAGRESQEATATCRVQMETQKLGTQNAALRRRLADAEADVLRWEACGKAVIAAGTRGGEGFKQICSDIIEELEASARRRKEHP